MVQLEGCCCCSLKTGSLIIGWIGSVLGCIYLLLCTVLLVNVDMFVKALIDNLPKEDSLTDESFIKSIVVYSLAAIIVASIIILVFYGLLVLGIIQNKPKWILPYLVLSGFGLGVGCLVAVFSLIVPLLNGQFLNFFISLILFALTLGFQIYLFLVVYSLYKSMRDTGYAQADIRGEYGMNKR